MTNKADIQLRELLPIETLLHEQMLGRIQKYVQDNNVDFDAPPPEGLQVIAREVLSLLKKIGFTPFESRVMIRVTPDYYNEAMFKDSPGCMNDWQQVQNQLK